MRLGSSFFVAFSLNVIPVAGYGPVNCKRFFKIQTSENAFL